MRWTHTLKTVLPDGTTRDATPDDIVAALRAATVDEAEKVLSEFPWPKRPDQYEAICNALGMNDPFSSLQCSVEYARRVAGVFDAVREMLNHGPHVSSVEVLDYARTLRTLHTTALHKLEGYEKGDDTIFDATDAAHPAWWRGHDHTADVFAKKVTMWLDGEIPHPKGMREPWQGIHERIYAALWGTR